MDEAMNGALSEAIGQCHADAELSRRRRVARRVPLLAEDTRLFDASAFTPRSALAWLAAKEFWITNLLGDQILSAAREVLVSGLKTGKATSEIMVDLLAAFAPWIGDEDVIRDDEQLRDYRLETIVRTNVMDAYNHGRLSEFMDPEVIPFLNGVRYSAILDERTTEVCSFLDGKVFRPGDPDLESLLPPNHFNCRSIVVPIVVGKKVPESDFITPEEIGRAKGLADAKFLSVETVPEDGDEAEVSEMKVVEARPTEDERGKPLQREFLAMASRFESALDALGAKVDKPVEVKLSFREIEEKSTFEVEKKSGGGFRVTKVTKGTINGS